MYIKNNTYLKKNLTFLLFLFLSYNCYSQSNEYEIKTSFIFKFSKYTEWPTDSNETFIITVFGKSSIETQLEKLATSKKIKGKKIQIKAIEKFEEINNSNILFIPKKEKKSIPDIVEFCNNKPILIISETPNAAKEGTHINFYFNRENKIRFEINIEQLKKSNLKMSSYLTEITKHIK